MKHLLFITFIICCSIIVKAQNELSTSAGARGLAMANASVAFSDINSIFSNQAGLAHVSEIEALVFAEQRFALSEIRFAAAGIAYPLKSGTFGLNVQYYGFDAYNEQRIGLAYARKLTENLSIGGQFNYLNFRIPDYGSQGMISAEIGLRSQIFKKLALAVHIANPVAIQIVPDENLPTVFKIGSKYTPTKKVSISIEVEKDLEFKEIVKAGLEYQLAEVLFVRLGVATNPTLLSFGMGYVLKDRLSIDVAASYHQTLGFSPGLSLRFGF